MLSSLVRGTSRDGFSRGSPHGCSGRADFAAGSGTKGHRAALGHHLGSADTGLVRSAQRREPARIGTHWALPAGRHDATPARLRGPAATSAHSAHYRTAPPSTGSTNPIVTPDRERSAQRNTARTSTKRHSRGPPAAGRDATPARLGLTAPLQVGVHSSPPHRTARHGLDQAHHPPGNARPDAASPTEISLHSSA
ncbi:predicted protein [Streptomyces sp. AA4]|nr:predicted protein [Streptomyces sp. AA4]